MTKNFERSQPPVYDDWYESVVGGGLEQGDLLLDCPIYTIETLDDGEAGATFSENIVDALVLSQTCDLEYDKVRDVLVAYISPYQDLVKQNPAKQSFKSRDFRTAVLQGNHPNYALLPPTGGPPKLSWTIVNFHHLYSVPKAVAERSAAQAETRLRLRSPYREHLSHSFARYISRVALPITLHAFGKASSVTGQ